MRKMNILGIDSGFTGAIACIPAHGKATVTDMPVILVGMPRKAVKRPETGASKGEVKERRPSQKRVLNLPVLCELLADYSRRSNVMVFIEKATVMPKQGITGAAHYMLGYGQLLGIMAGLRIPYTEVTPQAWKKAMLRGLGREKTDSRVRAGQLFPYLAFDKAKDDGRAESLLIAEYGRRLTGS
jgi:hypothetical protein